MKIDNITYEKMKEEIEGQMHNRSCRLSIKALQLVGLKAFKMAVGRREEDHDMCIHILIDYVHELEKLEMIDNEQ